MKSVRGAFWALVLLVLSNFGSAWACTPRPGWRPPGAVQAFQQASLVVHGTVESVSGTPMLRVAKLRDFTVLKGGELPHGEVRTMSSATCGIGNFEVGREYVFFLRSAADSVSFLSQPSGDAARILQDLRSAGLVASAPPESGLRAIDARRRPAVRNKDDPALEPTPIRPRSGSDERHFGAMCIAYSFCMPPSHRS